MAGVFDKGYKPRENQSKGIFADVKPKVNNSTSVDNSMSYVHLLPEIQKRQNNYFSQQKTPTNKVGATPKANPNVGLQNKAYNNEIKPLDLNVPYGTRPKLKGNTSSGIVNSTTKVNLDTGYGTRPKLNNGEKLTNATKSIGKTAVAMLPVLGETLVQSVKNVKESHKNPNWNKAMTEQKLEEQRLIGAMRGGQARNVVDPTTRQVSPNAELKALQNNIETAKTKTASEFSGKAISSDGFGAKMMQSALEDRNKALEGMTGVSRMLGETGMSIAENLVTLPAALLSPMAPAVLMGARASASKAYELSQQGVSANEALLRGIGSGAIETFTEKIPLDNLLKVAKSTSGKAFVKNILKQSGIEATEEGLSYTLNYIADEAAKDPNANFDPKDFAQSVISGGLSGMFFGVAGSSISKARTVESDNKAMQEAIAQSSQEAFNNPRVGNVKSLEQQVDNVNEYIEKAVNNNGDKEFLSYAHLEEAEIAELSGLLGKDVTGYKHALRDNDIRHLLSNKENTIEDLKGIPNIIKNADMKFLGKPTNLYSDNPKLSDNQTIYYVKRYNGTTYYLEQVLDEEKVLATKQFKKIPTGTVPNFIFKLPLDEFTKQDIIKKIKELSNSYHADVPANAVPREHVQNEPISNLDNPYGFNVSHNTTDVNNQYMQNTGDNTQSSQEAFNNPRVENVKSLEQHTPEMQKVIVDYEGAVDEDVIEFIDEARKNPKSKWLQYSFGKVESRIAQDIKNLTGIDVTGFESVLRPNTIEHIDNRHGANGKANHSMADVNDIARMRYVLENYDNVKLLDDTSKEHRDKNNNHSPMVSFEKRINGTYYVIEAVPDNNRKNLQIVSAYIETAENQTKKEASQVLDAGFRPAEPTSKTNLGNASLEPNLSHNTTDVNNQYMQNAEDNTTVVADLSLFDERELLDLNSARKKVIEYAKANFPDTVVNKDTQMVIGISRQGMDKLLSGNLLKEKYASAFHVPELIENAKRVANASNAKEKTQNQVAGYTYFDSSISIDRKNYTVHIRVKNTAMGNKYYGHTLSGMKAIIDDIKIEPSARSFAEKSAGHPVKSLGSNIRVAQTQASVNTNYMQGGVFNTKTLEDTGTGTAGLYGENTVGAAQSAYSHQEKVSKFRTKNKKKPPTMNNANSPVHNVQDASGTVSSLEPNLSHNTTDVNNQYMQNQGDNTQASPISTPIRVGKATTIKNPYNGEVPIASNDVIRTKPIIQANSLNTAQNQIVLSQAKSQETGKSFRKYLTDFYNTAFDKSGGSRGIAVEGLKFGGKNYVVSLNKKAVDKVISDKNLSAEKIALFDVIDDVIENGEYVGSGSYEQHGKKEKPTIRFDYFETPISINGNDYIAKFDVEVFPSSNNYRTHKVINNIDLVSISNADVGPVSTANDISPSLSNPRVAQPQASVKTNYMQNAEDNTTVVADLSLFDERELLDLNKARKKVIEYAKTNFPDTVVNKDTQMVIGISRQGMDKLLSGNLLKEKYASAFHVPELIENARQIATVVNTKPKQGIGDYTYFDSPISIDGKDYTTHIRVRNTDMGQKYYGHTLSEMSAIIDDIKIEPSARSSTDKSVLHPVKSLGSNIRVAQPQASVNTNYMQNAEDVYSRATSFQEELNTILSEISKELNVPFESAPQKSIESMKNKVARKSTSRNPYNLLQMKDHVRGKITVNDFADIPRIESILRQKNIPYTSEAIKPTEWGYRGYHITFRNKDGLGAEIQITRPDMWAVKLKSDKIYEKWRNVDYNSLTTSEKLNYISDREKSNQMWAQLNLPDFTSFKTSSSESFVAENNSSHINGERAGFQEFSKNSSTSTFEVSNNRPVSVNTNAIKAPPYTNIVQQKEGGVNLEKADTQGIYGENTVGAAQSNQKGDREYFRESKILPQTKAKRKQLHESFTEIQRQLGRKFVDSGNEFARAGAIAHDDTLYPMYNNAKQARQTAESMIAQAQSDINGDIVGKSLADIFKPILDKGEGYTNAFNDYLLNIHHIDRMAQNKPVFGETTIVNINGKTYHQFVGKPVEEATQKSRELLRQHPEFITLANEVYKYNRNLMQYRVDTGLVSKEQAEIMNEMYPYYVPTFRDVSTVAGTRAGGGVAEVKQGIKKATGSSLDILPIHESMARQTMQTVQAGKRNILAKRLFEDAQISGELGGIVKEVSVADELFDTEANLDELPELRNTFKFYDNGKAVLMKVNPELYEGIKAISSTDSDYSKLFQIAKTGNDFYKKLITAYNPLFVVRNFIKDIQDVGMYSRDIVAFARNYPKAIAQIKNNSRLWQKYQALGGFGSSVFDYERGYKAEAFAEKSLGQKALDKVESINYAVEQAPRFAEFLSVIEKGGEGYNNLMSAMYAAADVTVNFGRSGTWGKTLNSTFVPFFNPSVQGFNKMVRTLTTAKGARAWTVLVIRCVALGVLPSVLNELIYGDDEEYKYIHNRDKDNNYLFKVGESKWLKIPKGRALAVFGNAGQRLTRQLGGDENAWAGYISGVVDTMAPINPFTSNIAAPILGATFNRTWYGTPIEPLRLDGLPNGERYDENTDYFSKWLGGVLNASPKKINYILDSYSGVLGDFILPIMTPRAEQNPVAKAFILDSTMSNKASADFYDKLKEITQKSNSSYTTEDDRLILLLEEKYLNKQSKAVSDLNKEMRRIENSDMLDKDKKQEVKDIKAVVKGIQKNALATLPSYEKSLIKYSHMGEEMTYIMANREVFGSEYAIKTYNKKAYENAVNSGAKMDNFFIAYFIVKGIKGDKDYSEGEKKKQAIDNVLRSVSQEERDKLYKALGVPKSLY